MRVQYSSEACSVGARVAARVAVALLCCGINLVALPDVPGERLVVGRKVVNSKFQ